MVKVIATARGYFGRILREPDDVFSVPDGAKASWFRPVVERDEKPEVSADDPAAADKPKRGKRAKGEPETVQAPTLEPFADAPQPGVEPVRAPSEANDITGQTQPDWVQPGTEI
mgnify:CR=1 FL=1